MMSSIYVSGECDMGVSDEQIKEFVDRNRDLIESLIELQKDAAVSAADAGRSMAHDAYESTEHVRHKVKDALEQQYNVFMDPSIQKHFMAMGLEFIAAMSEIIARSPLPDCFKGPGCSDCKGDECSLSDACRRKPQTGAATEPKVQTGKVDVVVED